MGHAIVQGRQEADQTTAHKIKIFFENANFRKFHEIFKLVRVQTTENQKFSSLARISLPRGAAVHISSVSYSGYTVEKLHQQGQLLTRMRSYDQWPCGFGTRFSILKRMNFGKVLKSFRYNIIEFHFLKV